MERMRKRNWTKRVKRVLTGVFCAALFCGNVACAEETTEFHIEKQTGKAGDTVIVPVEFHSGEEVGGFRLSVYYDPEVMEYQSLEPGDLIIEEGGIFDYNPITDTGEIIIVYVVADTMKADGLVANITFTLKQDCGETMPVGMGVDELVDSSEGSEAIPESQVTGVDETFQTKVDELRAQAAQSGDSSSGQAGSGDAADENAAGSDTASDGGTAEAGNADAQQGEEKGTEAADDNQTAGAAGISTEQSTIVIAAIAAGIALIVIAAVVLWKRKHK